MVDLPGPAKDLLKAALPHIEAAFGHRNVTVELSRDPCTGECEPVCYINTTQSVKDAMKSLRKFDKWLLSQDDISEMVFNLGFDKEDH